ncbi:MAG: response regulator [Kiritimatiellae bacterium]|nr:response regulator [Kiritimatiellia bacterium]
MRILVVDDEYVSRTKIKAILSAYGDCDVAPSGEIALDMFKKAHEESLPYGIITLDIKMPGMDGQQTLMAIRNWEKERECFKTKTEAKVLMVTILNDRDSVMASFRENCDGYLIKPVTPDNAGRELAKLGIREAD